MDSTKLPASTLESQTYVTKTANRFTVSGRIDYNIAILSAPRLPASKLTLIIGVMILVVPTRAIILGNICSMDGPSDPLAGLPLNEPSPMKSNSRVA